MQRDTEINAIGNSLQLFSDLETKMLYQKNIIKQLRTVLQRCTTVCVQCDENTKMINLHSYNQLNLVSNSLQLISDLETKILCQQIEINALRNALKKFLKSSVKMEDENNTLYKMNGKNESMKIKKINEKVNNNLTSN